MDSSNIHLQILSLNAVAGGCDGGQWRAVDTGCAVSTTVPMVHIVSLRTEDTILYIMLTVDRITAVIGRYSIGDT